MKLEWKGDMCEVLNMGRNEPMRLYCEGISKAREDHIIDNLSFGYIKSRVEGKFDGALIIDFESEYVDDVLFYFGERNGQ